MKIEESIALAKRLGLPAIVVDILEKKKLPGKLWLHFGCPEEIFMTEEGNLEERLLGRQLVPLWDDGNFARIVFYDEERSGFVSLYMEFPEEGLGKIYNWEQVMALEFKGLWESELEEEEMIHLAGLFEFEGIRRLLEVLGADPYEDRTFDTFLKELGT